MLKIQYIYLLREEMKNVGAVVFSTAGNGFLTCPQIVRKE